MTNTPHAPQPTQPPAAPPRPPLRRSRDNRVIGGVCGGVAEYLGVDPVLVRVIVVVLAIFGGGVLVYLGAWLLIPETGRDQSAAQQLVGGVNAPTTVVVITAIAIGLAVVIATSGGWFGIGPDVGAPGFLLLLATFALVVWLVRRDRAPEAPPQAPATPSSGQTPPPDRYPPTGHDTAVLTVEPTVVDVVAEPKPRRPRSVLGLLTVSAAALVAGALVAASFIVDDFAFGTTSILATSLAVVALGLLVGTLIGRSRGLIFLGIILVLATALSAVASTLNLEGGIGERTWQPATTTQAAAEFRLGIGEATLDLRDLDLAEPVSSPVEASVGIGELRVYVPNDVRVQVRADVSAGEIAVGAQPAVGGTNESVVTSFGPVDADEFIALDLEVGLGQITVLPESMVEPRLFNPRTMEQGAVR